MDDISRENALLTLEQAMVQRLATGKLKDRISEFTQPYRELMTFYRCAMMEVETKFKVLNEEFSLGEDNNPIASVKTRLKSPESIIDKLRRYELPFSVESIEENICDVAGVRVICSFRSDIYMLAEALLRQDDVTLIEKKDYIAHPKASGYRSLHLIISTPIFLHNEKRQMKVEVQLRTLAMDMWASLEHQIRYKKDNDRIDGNTEDRLLACAELSAEIDRRMQEIRTETLQTD